MPLLTYIFNNKRVLFCSGCNDYCSACDDSKSCTSCMDGYVKELTSSAGYSAPVDCVGK